MRLISSEELQPDMILAADVYTEKDSILLPKNVVLNEKYIASIRKHKIPQVHIVGDPDPEPVDIIARNIRKSSGFPEKKPVLTPELKETALQSIESIYDFANEGTHTPAISKRVVKQIDIVVDQLVDSLMGDKNALVSIVDLKSYDDYTYHHSLSVAVLSMAIAQQLGLSKNELNLMGRTGMLHDIGKTAIPIEIINKPSKLNNEEFEKIKSHSPEGFDYLIRANIGNEDVWRSVLAHHEKVDGTGYPNGLKGENIPFFARIISVADVYDALTSNRPYRKPMQPAEAMEYIMGNIGTMFDYDVVRALMRKIELYPVGSFVELSDGRQAVVLDNECSLRPLVKIIDTLEIIDLFRDREELQTTVVRILEDFELQITG